PWSVCQVRLLLLTLRSRTVHDADGLPVDELGDGDDRRFPWEEGVPREIDASVGLDEPGAHTVTFTVPDEHTVQSAQWPRPTTRRSRSTAGTSSAAACRSPD